MDKMFKAFDDNPMIPAGLFLALVVLAVVRRRGKSREVAGAGGHPRLLTGTPLRGVNQSVLDTTLFHWSPSDPFTIRDLLNGGCLILGRAGSGKTSSSGRALMQAITSNPLSGGLILAAKPEDADDVQAIFQRVGRLDDLAVFGPENHFRFNFLSYVGRGDARNVVRCMMMIGESLQRGEQSGGEDGDYWKAQCERLLETAVIALQTAGEEVTALNLHRFVMSHATKPEDVGQPDWQKKYQGQVLEKGFATPKPAQRKHDYEMAKDYWLYEFPAMADRTRSSILTYATQILHVFNTGLAKEMIAGFTNITPDAISAGKWVMVNFPPSSFGPVGTLINTGWKYLTELSVLKRQADETTPFVTLWCDEAHLFVNSFDSSFIAQCRSHRGCLVYLTQSVSSFYGAMRGQAGHHQADSLLANFSHAVIHACDPNTARWAVSRLGRQKETMWSGSSQGGGCATFYDQLWGNNQTSGSFSQHYEQVLQDQAFMVGRTGGPENGYIADAVVVKSGEPFANGASWLRCEFSQKG